MPHASFDGLRVLSLESRRAREVAKLIRTYNGEPFVVPAMREVPLTSNTACLDFGRGLLRGEYNAVLFLTGVGVRAMLKTLETEFDREAVLTSLRGVKVLCRGVKPQAALAELAVPTFATCPEPATWREVVGVIDHTFGESTAQMQLAVQEYGATNPEMIAALVERFDVVTKVPVYQWALPHDLTPLRESVLAVIHGNVDVVLFMTAVQVIHLFQIADEMGLAADLRRAFDTVVCISVGPTTTEELLQHGLRPDFEPSRPKMGFMINEAAQYAGKVLAAKRTPAPPVDPLLDAAPVAGSERAGGNKHPAASNVRQVAGMTSTMAGFKDGLAPLDILHEISSRIAMADPLHLVLERIVSFACAVIPCDSCFVYTVEGDKLLLRASKNPHAEVVDKLNVSLGQGVTGWVAQYRESVALSQKASQDPRFSSFAALPEDRFEAMLCTPLVCANRVVGVINVQHREPYVHTDLQRRLLSTMGIFVGAEIERARLETENSQLSNRLESRKVVERAKGILQRDLGLTEEDAYRTMQKESRKRRRTMKEVAEAILLAEELHRLPRTQESEEADPSAAPSIPS
ncbi:MAG: uroporphyrinogen-III synthase [Janthinobacterium lividum]